MKRLIAIILPVVILGSLITWRVIAKRTEAAAMTKQRAARAGASPEVCAVPAELREIQSIFEATGTLEAPLNVKISSKISGRINFLEAHEGDRVRRGQVLVRLDATEIEGEVRRQQAAVAEAEYRLAQAQINEGPTKANVATQIKQQAAAVASARADFDQVQQNLASQVATKEADVSDLQARVQSAQAAIDNAKAHINSVKATLNNAVTKQNRIVELYKQGYIAAQDVDDAKAEVAVQQASLEAAQGQLSAAQSARESVLAQKRASEHQVSIVKTKGQADIEAARQKLRQAEASLELAKANTAQNPAYQQGLKALRAGIASAKANLASARARRGDAVLTCPMDGYVTQRSADPGAMATPGQVLLTVQFFKQIWVNVSVPDTVSAVARVGQPITVTLDAMPGKTFTATVVQVNPSADPEARQFTVRAALDNSDNSLRPGMFAHVSLVTEKLVGVVAIPREAVQRGPEGDFVNLLDSEMKIERRPVTTGLADAKYVSVKSGLQPGEQVVTLCAIPLKEGQTVKAGGGDEQKGERGSRQSGPGGQGGSRP
ncbi:MAG: efflux RND transporter periplasmic adaptor subunit [Armatimonadia bacterium]